MKKALVLGLIAALGLGIAASAQTFAGSWSTDLYFDLNPDFDLYVLDSTVVATYTLPGWTFGSTTIFNEGGFADQYFVANGALGAFTFVSLLNFDITTPAFEQWLSGVKVDIAGIQAYGWFSLQPYATISVLGFTAAAGTATFKGEVAFNQVYGLLSNGLSFNVFSSILTEYLNVWDRLHGCATDATLYSDFFMTPVQTGGCICFSGAYIEVSFPFDCVGKLTLSTKFTLAGFSWFRVYAADIKLGVDWLWIDDFRIEYGVDYKSISRIDLDLGLGGVCFTPYIDFDMPADSYPNSGWALTGINLYALGLETSFGDVSLTWLTLFDVVEWEIGWDGSLYNIEYDAGSYCAAGYYIDQDFFAYDEYIKLAYNFDDDACCGTFGFEITSWFDIGSSIDALFGMFETEAEFKVGIGANASVSFMLDVTTAPVNAVKYIGIGFDISF
jgi:hypothetical protein